MPLPAVEALLAAAGARPSPAEDRALARRALALSGVLSLCAGVVFFVAANWDALGRFGRFGLVQALLAAAAAIAVWRPPPHPAGRLGLLGAFVLAGALLALVGQTYQTGADTYELFLAWAGLGLPLVVAAGWSGTWAAWAVVVNVALALLCGWLPGTHVLWSVFGGLGLTAPLLFAVAVVVDLALWAACEAAEGTRFAAAAAPWLGRLLVALATAFGTWGAVVEILDAHHLRRAGRAEGGGGILAAVLVAAAAVVALRTARRRRDVFPFAALAAAAVAVGLAAIVRTMEHGDASAAFLASAVWVVASSAGAGWALMQGVRRWRGEAT